MKLESILVKVVFVLIILVVKITLLVESILSAISIMMMTVEETFC